MRTGEGNQDRDLAVRFYAQGVLQGMQCFNQIITISTYALGFLVILKTEFLQEATSWQDGITITSAILFLFAIMAANTRNYISGNGLCRRGLFIIKSIAEGESVPKEFEKADNQRKFFSWVARGAFWLAIAGLVTILIIEVGKTGAA